MKDVFWETIEGKKNSKPNLNKNEKSNGTIF
jgi:hypothetical protein